MSERERGSECAQTARWGPELHILCSVPLTFHMTWEDVEQSAGSAEVQYKYTYSDSWDQKRMWHEHTDKWTFGHKHAKKKNYKLIKNNIWILPWIHTFQDYFPWAPNLATALPAEGILSHKHIMLTLKIRTPPSLFMLHIWKMLQILRKYVLFVSNWIYNFPTPQSCIAGMTWDKISETWKAYFDIWQ